MLEIRDLLMQPCPACGGSSRADPREQLALARELFIEMERLRAPESQRRSGVAKRDHWYSGPNLERFWQRVNALDDEVEHTHAYRLGVVLQNLEEAMLHYLTACERADEEPVARGSSDPARAPGAAKTRGRKGNSARSDARLAEWAPHDPSVTRQHITR